MIWLFACAAPPPAPSEARDLHTIPLDLPSDLELQAQEALERDAWRRESRFQEAVAPGSLFAATRVSQSEIDAHTVSAADLYRYGGQLFNLNFRREDGFGSKDLPNLRRFHTGHRGGPDAISCNNCHWRGGPAGSGDGADNAYLDGDGEHQSRSFARNPIGLSGLGFLELLAQEISDDLQAQRDGVVAASRKQGQPLKVQLSSKGLDFGWLGALPDGSLDTRGLVGVDPDLTIKPFGWKGNVGSIREMVEDSLLIHHGMESDWLVTHAEPERIGTAGGDDPDGDGIPHEISEGQVSALTLYLAMQEVPTVTVPSRQEMLVQLATGQELFHNLGCDACHVPALPLQSATYHLPARNGGPDFSVDLLQEAAEPRLNPQPDGTLQVYAYTDLRRHHMGTGLAESRPDRGIEADVFLTPPLWALSRTRPYLHDGRAPTVEAAILAHGGEAAAAQAAYASLPENQRYPLRLYLATLTRATRMIAP